MLEVDKKTFEDEVLKAEGYVLLTFMEMDVFLSGTDAEGT